MLSGAHVIISSTNPEADRAFLRDVLELPHVDVGDGWLIFGLPPAEIAVHPSEKNDVHELYLLCDGVETFTEAMKRRDIECGPVAAVDGGESGDVVSPASCLRVSSLIGWTSGGIGAFFAPGLL